MSSYSSMMTSWFCSIGAASSRPLDASEDLTDDVNRSGMMIISSVYFFNSTHEIATRDVRAVLQRLMLVHPLLRMRIVSQSGRKYWKEMTHLEPDLRMTSRSDWRPMVSENSRELFDHENGPLWRVTWIPEVEPVLPDPQRPYSSACVINSTHVVFDGVGALICA